VVAPIHPKAMPIILTIPDDVNRWLADAAEALALQRPFPDDALRICTLKGHLQMDATRWLDIL